MSKDEAWKIIEACRGWNTCQRSITGNAEENAMLDAKRAALRKAWETVGEKDNEQ